VCRAGCVFLLLTVALSRWATPVAAQEVKNSLAGEQAAQDAKKTETLAGYNLHWGPASLQVQSSLHAEFTDNALNASLNRSADFILTPEVKLRSYYPISDLNALTLSLGVSYEYYTRNTQINPDSPLISPDSELAFLLYVKDFRFRFHESFSYQESLYYGLSYSAQGGSFINLQNLGTFGRIDNLAGVKADWDLSDLVLSLGYDHENFISMLSLLDYMTRASELFSASAEFIVGPQWRAGLESKASWNAYDTHALPDHWRARVGPYVDLGLGDYVKLRVGGGYDGALIPVNAGLTTQSTPFYAYARASHNLNDWVTYWFTVAHENQLGWQTANAATTYLGVGASLRLIEHLDLSPAFSYGWGEESGPNYLQEAWDESYTYLQASLSVIYHIGERWSADVRYDYLEKGSTVVNNDFFRNRITLGVNYKF